MKKLVVLISMVMTLVLLTACGSESISSTPQSIKESETSVLSSGETVSTSETDNMSAIDSAQEERILTSVEWMTLYGGDKLVLNSDYTMMFGDNSGTWSQEDTLLTITYPSKKTVYSALTDTYGSQDCTLEIYADIVEENGVTVLRFQKEGKQDGEEKTFSIDDHYPADKIEEIKAPLIKKLGDTVSTDIVELTVKKASFGYYAESPTTSVDTGETGNVDEACKPTTATDAFFQANKGRVLVCLDYALKNTDRAQLDSDDVISFAVRQNEHYAIVKGYDLNDPDGRWGLTLSSSPIAVNGGAFKTNDTMNILMDAGNTYEIKVVGIAGFEAEDLSAPFELIATIKNSEGDKTVPFGSVTT